MPTKENIDTNASTIVSWVSIVFEKYSTRIEKVVTSLYAKPWKFSLVNAIIDAEYEYLRFLSFSRDVI